MITPNNIHATNRMNQPIKQAAAYARVSSEKQAQNRTVESQLTAIRERVAQDGLVLPPERLFIDDGYSGETLQRPSLESLRDRIAAGEIDRLYIHSPDRLARRYAYQAILLEEFQRAGVEVVFLNHQSDESPEGQMLLQMQGVIAEYERAKILERCRRGRRQRALVGDVSVFSRAPYGYRYIEKSLAGCARFEIIPEQATTVRMIYQWFVRDGLAISAICKRLNSEQRPTYTGKGLWNPSSVWGVLKNPAYDGHAKFGRTRVAEQRPRTRGFTKPPRSRRGTSCQPTATHEQIEIAVPAIVDEESFRLAQQRLEDNRRHSRAGADGPRHLLQGLVVCRQCGRTLVHHPCAPKGRSKCFYYRCTGLSTHRWGGLRICNSRAVRAEHLEQAVWSDVKALLIEPARLRQEYERRLNNIDMSQSDDSDIVRKMTLKVEQGLQRLIDAYEEGLITKKEFETRCTLARQRIQSLKVQAETANEAETLRHAAQETASCFEEFARLVHAGMNIDDFQTRLKILRLLVQKIEVDEQDIKISYKVDPLPFELTPAWGRAQDYSGRLRAVVQAFGGRRLQAARDRRGKEVGGVARQRVGDDAGWN
jgi:site-specific DNA recombinase